MGLTSKDSCVYLEGLKRLKNRGVNIVVDGESMSELNLPLIVNDSSDSGFYMGDFIIDESSRSLSEIRFTRFKLNEEGGYNRTSKVE